MAAFHLPPNYRTGWSTPSAPGSSVSSGPGFATRLSNAASSAIDGVRTGLSSPLRSLADTIAPKHPSDAYSSLGSGWSTPASSLPSTPISSSSTGTTPSTSGTAYGPGYTSTATAPITTPSSAVPTVSAIPSTATTNPSATVESRPQVGPPPTDEEDGFQRHVRSFVSTEGTSVMDLDLRGLGTHLDGGRIINFEVSGAGGKPHRLSVSSTGDGAIDDSAMASSVAGTTTPAVNADGAITTAPVETTNPAVTTDPSGLQGAPTIEEYARVAPPLFHNPQPSAPGLSLDEEYREYLAPGVAWSNWSIDRTDDLSALGEPKRLLDDKTAWIQKRYKDADTGATLLTRDEARELATAISVPESEDPNGRAILSVGLNKIVCDQILPGRASRISIAPDEMPTTTSGQRTASTMTYFGDELSEFIERSVGPPRGMCGYDASQVAAAKALIDDIASLGDQMSERHGLDPDETNHFSVPIGSLLGHFMSRKEARNLSDEEITFADSKLASAVAAFRGLSSEAKAELFRRGSQQSSRSASWASASASGMTTETQPSSVSSGGQVGPRWI
ncbi:hypothetical protein I317_04881 [Kwoniella heveanensis CBS 569]|nr:hypothetical protein I317_04881 [Kwoniella heveanensis CBS 569]